MDSLNDTENKSTSLSSAEVEARSLIVEAKTTALEIVTKAEAEAGKIREQLIERERSVEHRAAQLEGQVSRLDGREDALKASEETINRQLKDLEGLRLSLLEKLEKTASLSKEEAKKEILTGLEKELLAESARLIKNSVEKAKEESEQRAKDILISSIQRVAVNYVPEFTTTRVKLPDADFKGRIIGFKGRNIQSLERSTGVTIDLDEAPDEVRLSSFDGLRREVARLALERLIADGRIQPNRIEEEVEKAKENLEKDLKTTGEHVAYEAGIHGLPDELLSLLGRYKFRTSYGQNLISHSLEVMTIAKLLASELGADVEVVKTAALLHDIGKVKTSEVEGTHALLTRQIMEKFNFPEKTINAAAAHHAEEPFNSLEAVIVQIADAVSGSRPGARFEDYEEYLHRMKALEETALSFEEVKEAFALAAGRNLRVIVKSDKTDDASVAVLSRKIADRIEKEQVYPGQIEVTVIKELRSVELAK
ncbi:MAG: ribonuclease Y [Patescibacteria group bacterium]